MEDDPNVMRRGRPADYEPAPKSYELSGKIMLSAIVILFTAVLLILVLHIYARCCLLPHRRPRRRRRRSRLLLHPHQNPTSAPRGLDAAVLRSLPVFVFSSKTTTPRQEEPLECAVCLSEFEDGEMGRLLPKCNHRFHIDCIDMWFHSHSACPLCRSDVKPDSLRSNPNPNPNPNPSHVVENLGESAVGVEANVDSQVGCSSFGPQETGPCSCCSSGSGSSSSTSSSGVCSSSSFKKKALGFVGMGIEVPTREVEIAVVSPGGQGQKSPGNRILALKRMLSRERRVVAETDLERGEEQQPTQNHS